MFFLPTRPYVTRRNKQRNPTNITVGSGIPPYIAYPLFQILSNPPRPWDTCFPVNFEKFLKTSFFIEQFWRLFQWERALEENCS